MSHLTGLFLSVNYTVEKWLIFAGSSRINEHKQNQTEPRQFQPSASLESYPLSSLYSAKDFIINLG